MFMFIYLFIIIIIWQDVKTCHKKYLGVSRFIIEKKRGKNVWQN
jgi:hypothetical protein